MNHYDSLWLTMTDSDWLMIWKNRDIWWLIVCWNQLKPWVLVCQEFWGVMKLHVSPGPGMEFQTQDETDVSGCQIGFSFLFSGPHLPFHPFLMSLTSSKRQVIGTKTLPVMKPGKMGGKSMEISQRNRHWIHFIMGKSWNWGLEADPWHILSQHQRSTGAGPARRACGIHKKKGFKELWTVGIMSVLCISSISNIYINIHHIWWRLSFWTWWKTEYRPLLWAFRDDFSLGPGRSRAWRWDTSSGVSSMTSATWAT